MDWLVDTLYLISRPHDKKLLQNEKQVFVLINMI